MDALLLIDIQNDYFRGGRFPLKNMKRAAANAAVLAKRFRDAGMPVVHIRHISLKEPAAFFEKDTFGSEINSAVSPLEGEKVFIKHYPSSFRETGLGEYLEEKGVKRLHVAGAMTNMCVDTTVRAGFDLGYEMILYSDACAARGFLGTSLVHKISIKTLGSVFAEVKTAGR